MLTLILQFYLIKQGLYLQFMTLHSIAASMCSTKVNFDWHSNLMKKLHLSTIHRKWLHCSPVQTQQSFSKVTALATNEPQGESSIIGASCDLPWSDNSDFRLLVYFLAMSIYAISSWYCCWGTKKLPEKKEIGNKYQTVVFHTKWFSVITTWSIKEVPKLTIGSYIAIPRYIIHNECAILIIAQKKQSSEG